MKRRTISPAELATITGATPRHVENWLGRGRLELATKYAKTTAGRAREFTRDNAVELALIHRLVKAGVMPSAAAERVSDLFRLWKRGEPAGWVLFVCDEDSGIGTVCLDGPPTTEMLSELDEIELVFVAMNAARIVDRIDAYFDADERVSA